MKRVLYSSDMAAGAVTRLLELLNRDERAARQMGKMQVEIARACGDDSRCADIVMGRWIERARRELGDDLLRALLALAGTGVGIQQVRRCENLACNHWMYARRKDQRACSPLCRHRMWEQKPEKKERRNDYMRWYWHWKDVPAQKRLTFEQWRQYKQPTPSEWEKGRK